MKQLKSNYVSHICKAVLNDLSQRLNIASSSVPFGFYTALKVYYKEIVTSLLLLLSFLDFLLKKEYTFFIYNEHPLRIVTGNKLFISIALLFIFHIETIYSFNDAFYVFKGFNSPDF